MKEIKFDIKGTVFEQLIKEKSSLMQLSRDLSVPEKTAMEWIESNKLPTRY